MNKVCNTSHHTLCQPAEREPVNAKARTNRDCPLVWGVDLRDNAASGYRVISCFLDDRTRSGRRLHHRPCLDRIVACPRHPQRLYLRVPQILIILYAVLTAPFSSSSTSMYSNCGTWSYRMTKSCDFKLAYNVEKYTFHCIFTEPSVGSVPR